MSEPSFDDKLAGSRDERFLRIAADRLESSITYLRFARGLSADTRSTSDRIDGLIKSQEDELAALRQKLGGRLHPRLRPNPQRRTNARYTFFVDECGNHALNAKESFGVFCLSGVLVADSDLQRFDELWKAWKTIWLGSSNKVTHEPDIRNATKSFWFDGDAIKRSAATNALDAGIEALPYIGFVCVLDRASYVAQYGKQSVDSSLPQHPYLMTLNFLAERVALALEYELGGATARWVIESRGAREDAAFQFEFARLFLDGTTYLTPHFFRHVYKPGLEFANKASNISGLQIADLQARPCGEKVQSPNNTPPRWNTVRKKLCRGAYTAHSVLGFKVMPWDPKFDGLLES